MSTSYISTADCDEYTICGEGSLLPPPHVKVLQISLQIAKCIKVQVHGEDTKKQLQHYYCSLCIYHSIDVKIDEPC